MIITLGGKSGSGKSTVAKLLAKKLNFEHYSNGDFMRELARQKNISLLELSKIAETTREIDEILDKRQRELGESQDNFIIDSRLGFHFIPNSKKIFLDADLEIRAKRILNDKIRKESNITLKEAIRNIKLREKSEMARYKQYYNLNPYDKKNFDFVINTTKSNSEEITKQILDFVNSAPSNQPDI